MKRANRRVTIFRLAVSWAPVLVVLAFAAGCSGKRGAVGKSGERQVVIFHAASLALPFDALEKRFEARHPGVDVVREMSGSLVAIRKVTELNRDADIVVSADYFLIPQMMMPNYAEWYAAFARNRIVIAYTDKSRYKDEIDKDNWYKILLRKGVHYGHSDPDMDPSGYRTVLTWRLADLYYGKKVGGTKISDGLIANCPKECIRPDSIELLPLLESMSLDYVFLYESVAKQQNLQYLRLPEEVDLSSEKHKDFYARANIQVTGNKRGEVITQTGKPIVYGITIVKDAPHPKLALEFAAFLLGPEGRKVISENFQEPIAPALVPDPTKVPPELSEFVAKGEDL
jgi:molybdate/tungstate transport system substrate-binding protein